MKKKKTAGSKGTKATGAEVRLLREKLKEREGEIRNRCLMKQMHITENIRRRAEMNETLRKALAEDLKQAEYMLLLATKGWVPVLVADKCNLEEVGRLESRYGLDGKWLFVLSGDDYGGIGMLDHVGGVICRGRLYAMLMKRGVRVINMDGSGLERSGDFGMIRVEV